MKYTVTRRTSKTSKHRSKVLAKGCSSHEAASSIFNNALFHLMGFQIASFFNKLEEFKSLSKALDSRTVAIYGFFDRRSKPLWSYRIDDLVFEIWGE